MSKVFLFVTMLLYGGVEETQNFPMESLAVCEQTKDTFTQSLIGFPVEAVVDAKCVTETK